jgi:hypothetical protein
MADKVIKYTETRYKIVQSAQRGSQGDVTPAALAAMESAANSAAIAQQVAQQGTAYPLNTVQLTHAESTGYGVISGIQVTAQTTPNMTAQVTAGVVHMHDGKRFAISSLSALAIDAADAINPRIDLVYVDSGGVVIYLAGTPSAPPVKPTLPTGGLELATISVAAGATSITSANITDLRIIKPSTQSFSDGTGIINAAEVITKNGPEANVLAFKNLAKIDDWTAAVQGAINHLPNGGSVRFPYRMAGYTYGDIAVGNNITFIAENGAVLIPKDSTAGFNLSSKKVINFLGVVFNCGNQVTGGSKAVSGSDVSDVWFHGCEIKNGFWGVFLSNVKRGVIENCHGYGFAQWAFYVEGCDGFKYINNICHDNIYDGLKLAGTTTASPSGTLKNIEVAGNISYSNTRDGFDLAGNDIENVNVHDNIFYDNTLKGIDFKNVYQGTRMKNVKIHDNTLLGNMSGDINCRTDTLGYIIQRVEIYHNTIHSASRAANEAIILCGATEGCFIKDNIIDGQYTSIRLIDCDKVKVDHNNVKSGTYGIQVETQIKSSVSGNIIEKNDITTDLSSCVVISSTAVSGTIIRHNDFNCPTNVYEIADLGVGTVAYMNSFGYASSVPSRKATKGTLMYNTSVADGGCLGWIAVTKGDPATWKPWGIIGVAAYQAPSTATDIAGIRNDLNNLMAKLRAGGQMAAS